MKESGRIVPVEPVVSKRTVSLCHGSISYRQQIARVFVHPVACLNRLVLSLYIHFPSNLLFPEQRRRCCSPVPMEDKTVTPISTPSSESATFDIGSIQVKTKYILSKRVFCCVCYFIMRIAQQVTWVHWTGFARRWICHYWTCVWLLPGVCIITR